MRYPLRVRVTPERQRLYPGLENKVYQARRDEGPVPGFYLQTRTGERHERFIVEEHIMVEGQREG